MESKTEVQLAQEAIDDFAGRIRQKREEFLAHGIDGEQLDDDLDEMMAQHGRIHGAIKDDRSPTRQTLDAEVAVLRSMFDRWVTSNERRFDKSGA